MQKIISFWFVCICIITNSIIYTTEDTQEYIVNALNTLNRSFLDRLEKINNRLNDVISRCVKCSLPDDDNMVGLAHSKKLPKNCDEALKNTGRSGVYKIQIEHIADPFKVYCTVKSDGNWMTIQRRVDDTVNFFRNWSSYKKGFGDVPNNYFIGLEKLHVLTQNTHQELLVEFLDKNKVKYVARYSHFVIGNENEEFILSKLGEYSGNATNQLIFHKNSKFSTYDNDNDESTYTNCAEYHRTAGWANMCFTVDFNSVRDKWLWPRNGKNFEIIYVELNLKPKSKKRY